MGREDVVLTCLDRNRPEPTTVDCFRALSGHSQDVGFCARVVLVFRYPKTRGNLGAQGVSAPAVRCRAFRGIENISRCNQGDEDKYPVHTLPSFAFGRDYDSNLHVFRQVTDRAGAALWGLALYPAV